MSTSKKTNEKKTTDELLKNLDVQNKALRKILKKIIKENQSEKSNK